METEIDTVCHNNKIFKVKSKYKNKIHFKCKYSKTLNCKASLVYDYTSNQFNLIVDHNKNCSNLFEPGIKTNETMTENKTKEILQMENSINIFAMYKTDSLSNSSFSNIGSIIKFKCRRKHLFTKF
jgi:hypothetical protein